MRWGGELFELAAPLLANDFIHYANVMKASWKTLKKGFRALLGQWIHSSAGNVVHLEKPQRLRMPSQYLALCISSIWLFLSCILYNKLVNVSVCLSSVSHFSKLLNLRRGLWEPLIYSWSVRSIDDNSRLATDIWSGGEGSPVELSP